MHRSRRAPPTRPSNPAGQLHRVDGTIFSICLFLTRCGNLRDHAAACSNFQIRSANSETHLRATIIFNKNGRILKFLPESKCEQSQPKRFSLGCTGVRSHKIRCRRRVLALRWPRCAGAIGSQRFGIKNPAQPASGRVFISARSLHVNGCHRCFEWPRREPPSGSELCARAERKLPVPL